MVHLLQRDTHHSVSQAQDELAACLVDFMTFLAPLSWLVMEHMSYFSPWQWHTAKAWTQQTACPTPTMRMLIAGVHLMLANHAVPEPPRAIEAQNIDTWSSHAHAVAARRTAIRTVDEEYHGGQYCTLLYMFLGASRVVITLCNRFVG